MSISVSHKSRASKILSVALMFVLALSQCTFLFRPLVLAQNAPAANNGQSRKTLPFTALPDAAEVLGNGGAARKAALSPAPPSLVPSTKCGFRDTLCHLKNGKSENNAAPANNPTGQKIATNETKPGGGFLHSFKKKVAGLFSGAAFSSLMNSGAPGNSFAPPATSMAPPPLPPAFGSANEAKVDPHTRIGTGGEDLFSGNYNWSLPLVSLPGRAGLDLNLLLSFNSLIWIRYGNTIEFEPDYYQSLTPGFRLGFPEIESGYSYDGGSTYLVTLPSGRRVPMRSVGRTTAGYGWI